MLIELLGGKKDKQPQEVTSAYMYLSIPIFFPPN